MRITSIVIVFFAVLGAFAATRRARDHEIALAPPEPQLSGFYAWGKPIEQRGQLLRVDYGYERAEGWIRPDGTIVLLWYSCSGGGLEGIQILTPCADGVMRGPYCAVIDGGVIGSSFPSTAERRPR
jgi:hypothetical protein